MKISHLFPLLVGLSASSHAALTQVDSYSFGSFASPLLTGTNFSGDLDFFDTQGGTRTLQNVEMRLSIGSVGGSGQGTSATGAPDATMDFESNLTVIITNPNPPNMVDGSFSLIPSLTVTSVIEDVFVPGDGGTSADEPFTDQTLDTGWVNVGSFAQSSFESPSPATFSVTPATGGAGTTAFATSGGSVETSTYTAPDYYGTLEVRYTYVPEPTAAMLGGVGLLALLRRRRKA